MLKRTPLTDDFKVYVFTLPKAGTYFIAEFLSQIGFGNSGMHISITDTLKTNDHDSETNSQFPSKTSVEQPFIRSMRQVRKGEAAFGHFQVPFLAANFPAFRFVCAYRHPRKTMVSEFIDFRFRRKDVKWCSVEAIPDDREAFAMYMERHAPNHLAIMTNLMALSSLVREPMYQTMFDPDRFFFVNFDDLRSVPSCGEGLCAFLGKPRTMATSALNGTLNADTKTKATDLKIDRDGLWSDRAQALYELFGVDDMVTHAQERLDWTI